MQIDKADLLKRLIIADASFLTLREKLTVAGAFATAEILASQPLDALSAAAGRPLKTSTWNGGVLARKADTALRLISAFGIQYTFFGQADYPSLLREMKDPPFVLFFRGDIGALEKPCVSVVGTRRATPDARDAAEDFCRDAANDALTVVSGLAYGIDVCAHRGALMAADGSTAAVLPGGIDTITPRAHAGVAAKILAKGGVILSEYTPGTPAATFRFVQRNRIIAALSPATVVVQAPTGSGAMITAQFALDYNRDVLFHAAAFSAQAEIVNKSSIDKIKLQKNADNKLKNSPGAFVNDGAPVISSYAEYKSCRASAPGRFSGEGKILQLF